MRLQIPIYRCEQREGILCGRFEKRGDAVLSGDSSLVKYKLGEINLCEIGIFAKLHQLSQY